MTRKSSVGHQSVLVVENVLLGGFNIDIKKEGANGLTGGLIVSSENYRGISDLLSAIVLCSDD